MGQIFNNPAAVHIEIWNVRSLRESERKYREKGYREREKYMPSKREKKSKWEWWMGKR